MAQKNSASESKAMKWAFWSSLIGSAPAWLCVIVTTSNGASGDGLALGLAMYFIPFGVGSEFICLLITLIYLDSKKVPGRIIFRRILWYVALLNIVPWLALTLLG